jgi:hypothetical protein
MTSTRTFDRVRGIGHTRIPEKLFGSADDGELSLEFT